MKRGLLLAGAQLLLVLALVAQYQWERARYPRAWAQVIPVDPDLPVRGRYLSLRLLVHSPGNQAAKGVVRCKLAVENNRLVARPDPKGALLVSYFHEQWVLDKPVAFFIPEHASDVTRQPAGRSLWAEVTVPPSGEPRPIQLAVSQNGRLIPVTE